MQEDRLSKAWKINFVATQNLREIISDAKLCHFNSFSGPIILICRIFAVFRNWNLTYFKVLMLQIISKLTFFWGQILPYLISRKIWVVDKYFNISTIWPDRILVQFFGVYFKFTHLHMYVVFLTSYQLFIITKTFKNILNRTHRGIDNCNLVHQLFFSFVFDFKLRGSS